MFDEKDLEQFKKKGTNAENVKAQLELIRNGFPYLELEAAASVGNGIIAFDDSQRNVFIKTWDAYLLFLMQIILFLPLNLRKPSLTGLRSLPSLRTLMPHASQMRANQ